MEQTGFFVTISIGLLPIRSCLRDRRPTLFLWPQIRVTGGKGGLEREGGAAVMRAGDEDWREREGGAAVMRAGDEDWREREGQL